MHDSPARAAGVVARARADVIDVVRGWRMELAVRKQSTVASDLKTQRAVARSLAAGARGAR